MMGEVAVPSAPEAMPIQLSPFVPDTEQLSTLETFQNTRALLPGRTMLGRTCR
jgi:hypothetical protein